MESIKVEIDQDEVSMIQDSFIELNTYSDAT